MKHKKKIESVGLYAIISERYNNGKIVIVERDRYGFYWLEGWHKSRVDAEDNLMCWKLGSKYPNK